jgi:eukaryotic-like serine/threonine-protein kinase
MSDSRSRISDLYHRTLDQPPGARRAYLDEACDGDDVLRAEVESLLRYEPAAAELLERPAAAIAGGTASPPARPTMVDVQLGPYTILAPLGAGGMGEVYRARDTKLGREVALKILPPHLTADPERRARFVREARVLATLNHPHIGAIYGLEDADGVTALALELVEGQTLANRLARGPLPVPQALAVARQIADALDAAHEKGIVHRDLKPANIVVQSAPGSSDVSAKVLDFGLAKLMADPRGQVGEHQDGSVAGTEDGRILGTPAYMSPEQARGLPVDKRTDIWAFGCVLFEMLSGRRPFDGDTLTDTFAHILEGEPDWAALPAETPAPIRRLLRRCLRKDAPRRLHDVADAAIEIDECDVTEPSSGPAPGVPRASRETRWWILAAVLVIAAVTGAVWFLTPRLAPADGTPYAEFPIRPPAGVTFAGPYLRFALAPDGSHLAFPAMHQNRATLWVRPLKSLDARMIPGTEEGGGFSPFWRPDSRELGFFAGGKLRTIPLAGGPAFNVADVQAAPAALSGSTWNREDVIVFQQRPGGPLERVSARGGTPTPVTALEDGDRGHRWPFFLPDGHRFLYAAERDDGGLDLRVGSLDAAPRYRSARRSRVRCTPPVI